MSKRKGSSSGNDKKKRKTEKAKMKTTREDKTESHAPSKIDFASSQKVLESLISSKTVLKEFFAEYWEKKPLHVKREDVEYYGEMFTKENLVSILKKHNILYEDDINVCRFVDGEKEILNKSGRATAKRIQEDVEKLKATVQFHQPQRFKDGLWQLNAALEKEFGCLVGANVYITPAGAQGLAPHYDDVEVFILQLEGKKQWSLYKPPVELPQDYSPDLTEDLIGEPTHKILLEPGDLLYFPRGTVHQACTPEEQMHSTHLTLSTYQNNNWGNLIKHGLSHALEWAMEEDIEFRRGLPFACLQFMGYSKSPDANESTEEQNGKATNGSALSQDIERQDKFKETLKQLLTRLADYFDPHITVDEMAIDFMSSRLPPYLVPSGKTDEKSEKADLPPEDTSEVRLLYPDHVRLCVGQGPDSSDEEEGDKDEDSEDDESTAEEEDIEESSNEEESKKRPVKASKKKKKKPVSEDEQSLDEDEEEDTGESSEEEETKKRPVKASKKKKDKKKSSSGDESSTDEDEYQEEDDLGEEWLVLYHSVSNDRTKHMVGVPEPYGLKFSMDHKEALFQIIDKVPEYLLVSSLPLPEAKRIKMVTSLWAEGLLEVKQQ